MASASAVWPVSPSRRRWLFGTAAVLVVLLSLWQLTNYPTPWYDEGSHLHVPKTLLRFGQYADYSSDGFRYYGPTIGVGPTVLLPIAAIFKVAGEGLFQARLVIVLYLWAALAAFFVLARRLGGERLAWAAAALLLGTRSVALLDYGRQVLGEVPGFFFVAAGLAVWFTAWEKPGWRRLTLAGLLLGLAVVTKSQYFIVIAPAVFAAWVLNRLYYRSAPQRVFLIPGIVLGLCFAVWQVTVVLLLGPGAVAENLALYRAATASAAAVFSPDLMRRALGELLSLKTYFLVLAPALVYGAGLALPRTRDGQRWGVLWLIIGVNLAWYVAASVSWIRYALVGLALSSLFVARFFEDLTGGFRFDWRGLWPAWRAGAADWPARALRAALGLWLAALIAVPLAQSARPILRPPFNAPRAMADYLNANVSKDVVIETWEPELGFLTDHTYHFPPQVLLYKSVSYIWAGGPPPSEGYTFIRDTPPEYVLAGQFSKYVAFYPADTLSDYTVVTEIGPYTLYRRR